MLQTDYLVIGAGAASLAFIDTLLAELPNAKIMLVDKHENPGGHWNDAYGYVHLHQPSLLYGVQSSQLEGNWLGLLLLKGQLFYNHRASKKEILAYYKKMLNKWIKQESVSYYPWCVYDFENKPDETSRVHTFHTLDGNQTYNVRVQHKLINGTLGECQIPSTSPPKFPLDKGVPLVTPNDLFDTNRKRKKLQLFGGSSVANNKNYVIMGCGKTAMDAVVYLQRDMGVSPDNISWVIPNDVWILRREGHGGPSSFPEALLKCDLDPDKAGLMLEEQGVFCRIDPNVLPTKHRFPVLGEKELVYCRKVKNVIRQGRISRISKNTDSNTSVVSFQKGPPLEFSSNTFFVHCTSPGPFTKNMSFELFPNEREMNLWLLFAPPVPISMSCLAVLEGRRRKGLLDLDFGRALLGKVDTFTDNDVLNALITGFRIDKDDIMCNPTPNNLGALTILSRFLCLFADDPEVGFEWKSQNRLSILSVPNIKVGAYETLQLILSKEELIGLSPEEVRMYELMAERLKPLEGR